MKIIKSIFFLLLIIVMVFYIYPAYAANPLYPQTNGKAVILMDATSGRVLYERNSHQQLPPASLTKIMTALLVVENGDLNQNVVISEFAAATPESTVYLEPGETLTRMELLYAAMLPSANDACNALAESIAGNEANFVKLMNKRVRELGLKNTQFKNAHGLHAEGHYSSAYDLALLSKKGLSNPLFAQVTQTQRKVIPWEGKDEDRLLLNQNRLLYRYEGAIGVKTGYTRQAGNCVVGAARRGDMVLIAVSMNSPTVYEDLENMLNYGFNNYKMITLGKAGDISGEVKVLKGNSGKVRAKLSNDLSIAATEDEIPHLAYSFTLKPSIEAPVKKGEVLGKCRLYLQGKQIGNVDMIAAEEIPYKPSLAEILNPMPILFSRWGILIAIIAAFGVYRNRKILKKLLKRIILYLLHNKIPNQYKNHRY